jgi:transposase-like protein
LNTLYRKISNLEEENYILKKASAFFAQNQK